MSESTLDSPLTQLKDVLSDGQWHSEAKLKRLANKHFKNHTDFGSILNDMRDKGILLEGANNSYRMTLEALTEWRVSRGLGMRATPSDMTAPRFFGGVLEDDAWGNAPLRVLDVVHFHSTADAARTVGQRVGLYGMTLYNFEGLTRVYTLHGPLAAKLIQEVQAERTEQDIRSIRIDKNARRRELTDLPEGFVNELCEFYGEFTHALLRQSMSSVKKHIVERDDVQQQIYLWIIDAIQRYNHETSIPFAAYLHSSVNKWVFDLSRQRFGRAVSDSELQISRARASFINAHNRAPSDVELAEEMGESIERVKQKLQTVNSVSNIRDAASIANEEYELPLPSHENSTQRHDHESQQNILSAAITTSALERPNSPNITAWCAVYNRYWGAEKSSDRIPEMERKLLEQAREKLTHV